MQLHELQKHLMDGRVNDLYMFTGEEVGIMDIYIEKIIIASGLISMKLDTVADAYSKMTQRRMSKENRVFIVRYDADFTKDEKAWDKVSELSSKSNDILILVFGTIDKRSKFWKRHEGVIAEFEKVSPEVLTKHIQKKLMLSTPDANCLGEMCELNYSRTMLEIDKVNHFCNASGCTHAVGFEHLKTQGVIYQPIGDITFKLTDAIATRQYSQVGKYLTQAKAKLEPEILVLSVLYNTFKQILMVQGLGSDTVDASRRTGLTAWQVKMAIDKKGHYSIAELIGALRTIQFVEKGIKIGQIDADIALEYTIVNIM